MIHLQTRQYVWLSYLAALALFCVLVVLPGCAALKDNTASEKVLTQYAVMKVIEADRNNMPARAIRIHDIASQAKSFFDTGTTTLPDLAAEVNKRLEPLNLSPADRLLASALIDTVVAQLQQTGATQLSGTLSAEQRLQVSTVLGWVADAAAFYVQP